MATHTSHSKCPTCQKIIVEATLSNGTHVSVNTGVPVYRIVENVKARQSEPVSFRAELEKSMGYTIHHCEGATTP